MSTTTYEIHPAIGIARLGSSPLSTEEGYFLGPEPGVAPPLRYRDPAGNLKRQAACFRVFACRRDDQRRLLDAAELPLESVRSLTWTVHLVNRKGTARRRYNSGRGRRNGATGDDDVDRALINDPGPRSIRHPGERATFDTGMFRTTAVKLGEILTEPDGRLVVLGGHGHSGSDPQQPRMTLGRGHFASNDHWFDDTSDGPVVASLELLDGAVFESRAWVVVGPPDFAPGITSLVTLYDVLFDRAVTRGVLPAPTADTQPISFTRHVQPIFERALGYRWVNRHANFGIGGNGRGHGTGGRADFSRMWNALSSPSAASRGLRQAIVARLRDPGSGRAQTDGLLDPRLSDVERVFNDANNVLRLTPIQYAIMQAWAAGDFVNDLGAADPITELLPDALNRTALEACVGGALFPGIEVNAAIASNPSWFMNGEPFRLSHDAVRPGMLTADNAVPWQADYHLCRWEEFGGVLPKRLAWWPAQRPDDVYLSTDAPDMVSWARGLGEDFQDMIDKWDRLGVVVNKGDRDAPFFIEQERDSQVLGT